jgi:hypothetical protein
VTVGDAIGTLPAGCCVTRAGGRGPQSRLTCHRRSLGRQQRVAIRIRLVVGVLVGVAVSNRDLAEGATVGQPELREQSTVPVALGLAGVQFDRH